MNDIARLELENKKVRERCKELEEVEENYKLSEIQCQSAREQINILQCDKDNLRQTNTLLDEEFRSLKEKFQEVEQDKCHLEKELQETEKKVMESTFQFEEFKREVADFRLQTSNSMSEQAQIITNLKRQIQDANLNIERLSLDNKELSDYLSKADTEVELQKKEKEEIAEKHNKTIKEKEDQIQNLKEELREASLGTDETVRCMLENKTLRAKNKENAEKIIFILKENEELQSKNEQYENQIKEMKASLEKAAEKIQELEAKNKEFAQSNEELKESLESTQNTLAQTTSERDHLTERKHKLEENVEELIAKHSEAQQNLNAMTSQFRETVEQKEELNKQLEAMNELKTGSLKELEDNMKSVVAKIATTSEEFFKQLQQAQQQLDEQALKHNLDGDGKE